MFQIIYRNKSNLMNEAKIQHKMFPFFIPDTGTFCAAIHIHIWHLTKNDSKLLSLRWRWTCQCILVLFLCRSQCLVLHRKSTPTHKKHLYQMACLHLEVLTFSTDLDTSITFHYRVACCHCLAHVEIIYWVNQLNLMSVTFNNMEEEQCS